MLGSTTAGVGAGAFLAVKSILFSYSSSGGKDGNSVPPTWPNKSSSTLLGVLGENTAPLP